MKRALLGLLAVLAACAKKQPAQPAPGASRPSYAFIPLVGCTCESDVDGHGKEHLELELQVLVSGGALTWSLERPKQPAFDLLPLPGMAPPVVDELAADQAIGLACDGPIVAFASGRAVSGCGTECQLKHDSSTNTLIRRYRKSKEWEKS